MVQNRSCDNKKIRKSRFIPLHQAPKIMKKLIKYSVNNKNSRQNGKSKIYTKLDRERLLKYKNKTNKVDVSFLISNF